jgi:hypothetical protein
VEQVDPIKPTLKAPVSKSLKLKHDELLSNFAFKFNLRRYTPVFVMLFVMVGVAAYLHYLLNKKARPLLHKFYPDLVELYPVDGSEHSPGDVKAIMKKLAEFPLYRRQGLTLVQISAQLKPFLWDRGCT